MNIKNEYYAIPDLPMSKNGKQQAKKGSKLCFFQLKNDQKSAKFHSNFGDILAIHHLML